MALTGRFTFRRSFWGRIVLQVEEEVKALWPLSRRSPFKKRWRDATLMDLAAPELRALIDLRYKPQFMAQYEYLASDGPVRPPSPGEQNRVEAYDAPAGPPPHDSATPLSRSAINGPDLTVEVQDSRTLFGRHRARPGGSA
jgi:hypothetical protein